MKLLPAASLLGAVIILMFSCKSTGADLSKKYPNMVANVDPISAGSVEAEFDKLLSSQLNTLEVKVIFYPRLNAVALEFRYDFTAYRQFWDEADRKHFAEALENYKADYAARKLGNSYTRSKAAYGKVESHLEWERARLTQTYVSYPTIEIGYRFRNDTPFFATLMRPAREVPQGSGADANLVESEQINMYFTRAQAEALVRLFDQSYLMKLISGVNGSSNEQFEDDYYIEFGD
jgi:hypothetical protein